MDIYGWFIANLHQMLGHDKTAIYLGVPAGDKAACLICQYEHNPTPEKKQAVINAIGSRLS